MKTLITQAELKKILHYDCDSGLFTRLYSKKNPKLVGNIAGYKHKMVESGKTYIDIKIGRRAYRAHRLAFLFMIGKFPDKDVDHNDGDGTNNKWTNITQATKLENAKNHKLRCDNNSGVVGVYWDKVCAKWSAQVSNKRLGRFADFFEACCARKSAELKHDYHKNHGTIRPL